MKRICLISFLLGFGVICAVSQDSIVSIPDTAFLYALIEEGVDANGDSLISYEEAEAVTAMDVSSEIDSVYLENGWYFGPVGNIKLITGIEAFTNLDTLICNGNNIQSLYLSKNTKLKYVDCRFNGYPHWSASLKKYNTWGRMQSINVSICNDLEYLDCSENWIEILNVSNNPDLQFLDCSGHRLDDLDVSNNSKLKELYCSSNTASFGELDVSNNPELRTLYCELLGLESLDVSKNMKLEILHCMNIELSNLDVSNNPLLNELVIGTIISQELDGLSYYPHNITSLDLSNNPELVTLKCPCGSLNELDVSGNPKLEELNCAHNNIDSLDLAVNTALVKLSCSGNPLKYLNVKNNTNLFELIAGIGRMYHVSLKNLDISNNTALEVLYINSWNLDSLDLSNNTQLKRLYLFEYIPHNLDISNNTNLEVLHLIGCHFMTEVCVWEGFDATNIDMDTTRSPNICFQTDCNGECSVGGIEGKSLSGLSIFPNPTSTLLTIESNNPDNHSINITSLNGQLIYSTRMEGTTHQIDLSSFQKGAYFITIRSKDYVTTRKIIKL